MQISSAQTVYVALGSNLGESAGLVRRAMDRLQVYSREPVLCSSLWRTNPVDCPPDSPSFLNAAVAFIPLAGETPETLLPKLQALEIEFGRGPKTILNEARPLDLDLIAFGKETRSTGSLVLPHPRAHRRRFVLEPLNEIAPELILPGQSKSVARLLLDLKTDESVVRVP